MNYNGIDFIGDIHGHADELEGLLKKMGYSRDRHTWEHPNRLAFFVGDFIDRGPKIPEALTIIRNMVENGSAKAVMGNHEYNAICFNRIKKGGGYLREHSIKNLNQHIKTIQQFHGKGDEYRDFIRWFYSLPVFFETDDFRVVHASWDHEYISFLKNQTNNGLLDDELVDRSSQKGTPFYGAIDTILKGKELSLPDGYTFKDEDGHERDAVRMKWWENPTNQTFKSIAVIKSRNLPDIPVKNDELSNHRMYDSNQPPIFFGHYWLNGNPNLYKENVCCLDYSVANNGKLVAYRFDGEAKLSDKKLVYV